MRVPWECRRVEVPGRSAPLQLLIIHEVRSIVQFVDKQASPSLLPILRSQQQAELLAMLLGDPSIELSISELARVTGIPYPSVHREVGRAESAGLLTSRKIGNTRLVKANVDSPYYEGLADVLTKAFGPVAILSSALVGVERVDAAFIFGSWAARAGGGEGRRPIGDIDLLVLGSPDRADVFGALVSVEQRLGREVQVTFRPSDWLANGDGTFHQTVISRPMIQIAITAD